MLNGADELYKNAMAVKDSDEPKAVKLFKKAAKSGHADAQFELGIICECKGEENEAVKWHKMAAAQNHAVAQRQLGFAYEIYFKNYEEAVKWYARAAANGEEESIIHLDYRYKKYKTILKDWPNGLNEIINREKMAKDLHTKSSLCFSGLIEPQNIAKGMELLHKSAEMGYDKAQAELGEYYLNGNGVYMNKATSKLWYEKAAKQGNEDCL